MQNYHAFSNDALGYDDATGVAERIRNKEISASEALEAALSRVDKVEAVLNGIQTPDFERARHIAQSGSFQSGVFAGVPSIVKDNNDVQGLPTLHGSAAVKPKPAKKNGVLVEQLLNQGFVNIGKSTLPEFGFSASTEPAHAEPTRNPWNTDYSSGASSGGAAALVAAGVLPIAHANDGGGSIRIPAACCGLVGLKSSRGRLVASEQAQSLPVNVIADGVVTRSIRDTANFFAQAERYYRNPDLPAIGTVTSPNQRRLRIGYFIDSVTGSATDAQTRASMENTLQLLEQMGHQVEEIAPPCHPAICR